MDKEEKYKFPVQLSALIKENPGKDIKLNEANGDFEFVEREINQEDSQKVSLRGFIIPSVITTIIFYLFFYYRDMIYIPMNGMISIGSAVTTLGVLSGVIVLLITFILIKNGKILAQSSTLYWRNFPAILVAFTVILFLSTFYLFDILDFMLPGLRFDLYTATFLFLIIVAVIDYLMIFTMLRLTPSILINILTIVIIGGVIGAMMTNRDREWWQYNFSYLGTFRAKNSWQFNLTLVLSGVLMISLVDYLYVSLTHKYKSKKLSILRWLLILVAINLGAVGAFPYRGGTIYAVIHNQVASNLVYLIIVLILALPILMPKLSKDFLYASYFIMGILVLIVFLFQGVHYFSLTVFELLAFFVAFIWLLMLFQYLQGLLIDKEDEKYIKIYFKEYDEEN
ncbi:DUF998 domain-containing protein [Floricoccus penangensis]|uniref:DUF998 domain-containing protein n=1 Tax=Floricoccus penangensis TaxID=1859475 RepID=UPI00203C74A1|nr:AbrB/MazE/SpoVT family DNA-binding domain-containing protein [Floricoccus penangensis]URZ88276.1 DUF998 domain-containing protein [Floricoccus penangensis]